MSTLVSCRGVTCRMGRQLVLDRTDLDVADTESIAVLGGSGSGKSTLLRVMAGLLVPERGEVLIGGESASRDGRLLIPPHRRGIAMLFQDLALWPNLTVADNLRLGLSGVRQAVPAGTCAQDPVPGHGGLFRRAGRLSRFEMQQRIVQALELCGISELADRRPGTLSGGQQQRVALARALSMQPRLLLLDEPFGGLDLLTRETVIREVARLRSKLGFALILVTHDPTDIRLLCDSLAVLESGRIVDACRLDDSATAAGTPLGQAIARRLLRPDCFEETGFSPSE